MVFFWKFIRVRTFEAMQSFGEFTSSKVFVTESVISDFVWNEVQNYD